MNYIEVVPSLPTYYMDEGEIGRVLKLLFVPEEPTPVKVVLEYPFGRVELLDYEHCDIFSTLDVSNEVTGKVSRKKQLLNIASIFFTFLVLKLVSLKF